jgi:hypothetical protein
MNIPRRFLHRRIRIPNIISQWSSSKLLRTMRGPGRNSSAWHTSVLRSECCCYCISPYSCLSTRESTQSGAKGLTRLFVHKVSPLSRSSPRSSSNELKLIHSRDTIVLGFCNMKRNKTILRAGTACSVRGYTLPSPRALRSHLRVHSRRPRPASLPRLPQITLSESFCAHLSTISQHQNHWSRFHQ